MYLMLLGGGLFFLKNQAPSQLGSLQVSKKFLFTKPLSLFSLHYLEKKKIISAV